MENEISEGDILFAEAYEAVKEHTAAQQHQARFHDELKSSRESLDIAVLDVEEAASKLKDFRDLLETVCRALEDVSKRTIVLKRRADDAALIPDHEVRATKLTNRWNSGCWWGRDASSDEHLMETKHGLLECRSVRRKPAGEQWSQRETIEARGTKWNFDVEMDSGIPEPPVTSRPDEGMPTATAPMEIPTVPPPAPPLEEHEPEIRVHSNSGGGDVAAKTEMVTYDPSNADPAKTKVIGKVVRYTNILEAPIPELLNEDGKLIDTGQIIITQKLQGLENDINVTMVSWGRRVTSNDRYITIVSTVLVTTVTYLGFEYRSVHDGDHRGFAVKPTAKYVDRRVIKFNTHCSEQLSENCSTLPE